MRRDPRDPDGQYECCAQEGIMDPGGYFGVYTAPSFYEKPHRDCTRNPVDKPDHYTYGEREAIDYMRDIGVLEPYCVGNVFKYLYRYKHKKNPVQDLLKARQYIDILVKELERLNAE